MECIDIAAKCLMNQVVPLECKFGKSLFRRVCVGFKVFRVILCSNSCDFHPVKKGPKLEKKNVNQSSRQ